MLKKRIAVLAAAGSLLVAAAPAGAQPQQSGLVNVSVGDVNVLNHVGVGVTANVAAEICGVQVPVNVLAEQVVRNNQPYTACTTGPQNAPVTITPAP